MSALRVTEHAKKRSKDLSGGTKRKVVIRLNVLFKQSYTLLVTDPILPVYSRDENVISPHWS